jgi:hypothetical protein
MRWTVPFVALLLAVTASAATLYRWVDSNGVVHYSDRPAPGATPINVQSAQTFPAQPAAPATQRSATAASAQPAAAYETLELWKPENDETFINTANVVEARLRVEPDLQPGHSIWLYLDGKRVDGLPQAGETFTLNEVWRGTHTLNAVITDRSGQALIRSQTVTFHVQQNNVNSPQRANQAPPPRPTPRPIGGRPGN